MLDSHVQTTPPAQGTPFHGHRLTVAKIQKYRATDISNWEHVAGGLGKHPMFLVTSIATTAQSDTFQLLLNELWVLSPRLLCLFKGEKTQLLAVRVAKAWRTRRTVIVLVNACSLLNCLILEGWGVGIYRIVIWKASPEEKQMTQGISRLLSYSTDPGSLNSSGQNAFWSGFSWCLSPLLPASYESTPDSDNKIINPLTWTLPVFPSHLPTFTHLCKDWCLWPSISNLSLIQLQPAALFPQTFQNGVSLVIKIKK